MTLTNNRFFKRQIFEITSTGLKVDKKSLFDQVEYEIPFEQIHNKMRIQKMVNNNLIVLGTALAILGTLILLGSQSELTLLFYFAAFIFFGLAILIKKNTITIATYSGEQIELFFTNANKNTIKEYANQIIKAANSFLLNKYGKVDKDLPIERQVNDLHFLRDREILGDKEYETLKNQLLNRDNNNSIGFSR